MKATTPVHPDWRNLHMCDPHVGSNPSTVGLFLWSRVKLWYNIPMSPYLVLAWCFGIICGLILAAILIERKENAQSDNHD